MGIPFQTVSQTVLSRARAAPSLARRALRNALAEFSHRLRNRADLWKVDRLLRPEVIKMLDEGITAGKRQSMKWLDHENLVRSSVQLASDGRWEDAVPIESTDPHALRRWLAESGPNVAIEGVYCNASGGLQGFFGFRRIFEDVEERASFWEGVVKATEAYQSLAPGQQLAAWLGLLGVPSMLKATPSGTQLGVFNQWLSAGPVTLRGTRLNEADIASGPTGFELERRHRFAGSITG